MTWIAPGGFHSVTLSSLELEAEGDGTRVSYTEQIVFLDGKDGTATGPNSRSA